MHDPERADMKSGIEKMEDERGGTPRKTKVGEEGGRQLGLPHFREDEI